jgi:hypothetical protein
MSKQVKNPCYICGEQVKNNAGALVNYHLECYLNHEKPTYDGGNEE